MSDTHRDTDGRFTSGAPAGPGRPPGARNRAAHRLVLEIMRDFELNRELVLYRLRSQNLNSYVGLVKRIMPSQGELAAADQAGAFDDIPLPGDETEWRDAESEKSVAALRAAMARDHKLFDRPSGFKTVK